MTRTAPQSKSFLQSMPKRPLQDITDRFVANTPGTPSPIRPKRKPKTPGGALGVKIKSRTNPNLFPSSLPPSSPLPKSSSSSHVLPSFDLHSEDEDEAEQLEHDENDIPFYGQVDFTSDSPPSDPCYSDGEATSTAANISDPFGFFAVERKLKLERDDVTSRHHAPASSSLRTLDPEDGDDISMPPTPRKPKINLKRKHSSLARAAPDHGVLSPTTGSMSSTPSPVKAAGAGGGGARPVDTDGDCGPMEDQDDEPEDTPIATKAKSKRRAKSKDDTGGTGRKAKKPRGSGDSVDPIGLAMSLEALLPKKPAAKPRGRVKRKTRYVDNEDGEDGGKPTKRTRKATTKPRAPALAKTKRKKKAGTGDKSEEEEIDLDGDEQKVRLSNISSSFTLSDCMSTQRLDAERQARLEYFKKLEDYSFAKEIVYVI